MLQKISELQTLKHALKLQMLNAQSDKVGVEKMHKIKQTANLKIKPLLRVIDRAENKIFRNQDCPSSTEEEEDSFESISESIDEEYFQQRQQKALIRKSKLKTQLSLARRKNAVFKIDDVHKLVDESIISQKIAKIRAYHQFLEKYSIILHDLDPFIDPNSQLYNPDSHYTKRDSQGNKRWVQINSRCPNDEHSLSQKNLRRRQSLLKTNQQRKEKRDIHLYERVLKRQYQSNPSLQAKLKTQNINDLASL